MGQARSGMGLGVKNKECATFLCVCCGGKGHIGELLSSSDCQ